MAAKKQGTVETVVAAVHDAAAAAVHAAGDHVVKPVGRALGLTGPEPAAAPPAPARKKSPAARLMTRGLGGKKPAAAKEMSQQAADAARHANAAATGVGGNKVPRRGASKGG